MLFSVLFRTDKHTLSYYNKLSYCLMSFSLIKYLVQYQLREYDSSNVWLSIYFKIDWIVKSQRYPPQVYHSVKNKKLTFNIVIAVVCRWSRLFSVHACLPEGTAGVSQSALLPHYNNIVFAVLKLYECCAFP